MIFYVFKVGGGAEYADIDFFEKFCEVLFAGGGGAMFGHS